MAQPPAFDQPGPPPADGGKTPAWIYDQGLPGHEDEFVRRYHPLMVNWARSQLAPKDLAEDVASEVLVKLLQYLRAPFEKHGAGFRAFLRRCVKHAAVDVMRRRNARGHGKLVGDALLRQVEDSAAALAEQFDTAWRQDQALLREAAERVQRRIGPQRWQAFWLVAMDNLKPAEVARRLGLKPTQVYDATFDVKEQLREELKALGFGQSQ